MNEQYEKHCRGELREIKSSLNRVNEVVFNGYGERIKDTQKRVEKIEAKLNWLFVTIFGALVLLVVNLVI